MRTKISSLCILALAVAASSSAQTRRTLHVFSGDPDGATPESGLIMDAHGNFYGTTYFGGNGPCAGGCGTVFELTPGPTGGYTAHVLHNFQGPLVDGQMPEAPLIFDAQGNLYGTTLSGGQNVRAASGTVFKLSPNGDGTWQETVLHSFNGALDGGTDGGEPLAGLIFDAQGNLYGTTAGGGIGVGCIGGNGCGTIFELSPTADGKWHEAILHNFTNDHSDGWIPQSNLIMDSQGNFYGTTFYGGAAPQGGGTVYRLSQSGGVWQETVLYSFACGSDGCSPYSGMVFDAAGNLYGATVGGGNRSGQGTVYKLMPSASGWIETVIHRFQGGPDGMYPYGSPIVDSAGNVYGTTFYGGEGVSNVCSDGCGIVYKLIPETGAAYTESVLTRFGSGSQGSSPLTGLLLAPSGNLYGAAAFGGPHGAGVIFEILP